MDFRAADRSSGTARRNLGPAGGEPRRPACRQPPRRAAARMPDSRPDDQPHAVHRRPVPPERLAAAPERTDQIAVGKPDARRADGCAGTFRHFRGAGRAVAAGAVRRRRQPRRSAGFGAIDRSVEQSPGARGRGSRALASRGATGVCLALRTGHWRLRLGKAPACQAARSGVRRANARRRHPRRYRLLYDDWRPWLAPCVCWLAPSCCRPFPWRPTVRRWRFLGAGSSGGSRIWGPERIQTGWWRGQSALRDYYRVETAEGQWFWLFRQLSDRRWFLHGVFE